MIQELYKLYQQQDDDTEGEDQILYEVYEIDSWEEVMHSETFEEVYEQIKNNLKEKARIS